MDVAVMRRSRRPDSLAVAVAEVLDELQCPVLTSAMRVILNDRGRRVTAEHLGRLAAYQREDFRRSRIPPELCWALDENGATTKPRWWARGNWRLERRILTKDVKPIWIAHLAAWLCLDLAGRPDDRDGAIVTLTLGSIAQVLDIRNFEVPTTPDDWLALRKEVYAAYMGSFSNITGATSQQHEAEATLQAKAFSGFDLLFGRGDG